MGFGSLDLAPRPRWILTRKWLPEDWQCSGSLSLPSTASRRSSVSLGTRTKAFWIHSLASPYKVDQVSNISKMIAGVCTASLHIIQREHLENMEKLYENEYCQLFTPECADGGLPYALFVWKWKVMKCKMPRFVWFICLPWPILFQAAHSIAIMCSQTHWLTI